MRGCGPVAHQPEVAKPEILADPGNGANIRGTLNRVAKALNVRRMRVGM